MEGREMICQRWEGEEGGHRTCTATGTLPLLLKVGTWVFV